MTLSMAHGLMALAIVANLATRGPAAWRRRRSPFLAEAPTTREAALAAAVFAALVVLPMLVTFTDLLAFADYRFSATVAWSGAVLLVPAFGLYARAGADLARAGATRAREVITDGVYARVRHPMYAALWLWGAAQALLLANWIAGPAALVAFALFYAVRVPREEALLVARFGASYRDYMRCTDRLFPGIV